MLDCQVKHNRQFEKCLIRGTKAKRLPGAIVQAFHNPQNIVVSSIPEVEPLGQRARK